MNLGESCEKVLLGNDVRAHLMEFCASYESISPSYPFSILINSCLLSGLNVSCIAEEKRNTKANVSHEDWPTHSNTFPIGPETAGKETLEAAARALDSPCSFWWTSTTDTEDTEIFREISSLQVMVKFRLKNKTKHNLVILHTTNNKS